MSKAIGYVRVSTDKQADKGVSLDAQAEKIRQYSALHDFDLVDVVVDAGASAKSTRREGLQTILEAVRKREVDAVVFLKLDRLTRSVRDLGELVELFNKAGVAMVSIQDGIDTSTAAGRLVLNVLGSVAQWEREAIGERTSEALQHKASKNEFTGGCAPLGKRVAADGVHLEADACGQEALRIIRELKELGKSTRDIAAELERCGVKNGKGVVSWSHVAVARHVKKLAA